MWKKSRGQNIWPILADTFIQSDLCMHRFYVWVVPGIEPTTLALQAPFWTTKDHTLPWCKLDRVLNMLVIVKFTQTLSWWHHTNHHITCYIILINCKTELEAIQKFCLWRCSWAKRGPINGQIFTRNDLIRQKGIHAKIPVSLKDNIAWFH